MQDMLKPREIEILRLMADGLTNREIASRLFVGFETVRWYAKQIYAKLDVSGREEAADKAQSLGLLDADVQTYTLSKPGLPTQLTSFVGRETQISQIKALLNGTRLLTLIGPGGTGKTRLSLKVAESITSDFADGVYFVDLAPITEADRVVGAIASALGIFESSDEPLINGLKRAIGQRSILVILDNFEHVIRAASKVLELLTNTPNLKILITSREPLRISGEQLYPVPPLELPTMNDDDLPESVLLFEGRSQAVKPQFRLDNSNRQTVFEICTRLDGLPLAIELAAALSRFLTPDAILSRMDNRFHSLKSGSRDAPVRQQTLRNTIDWSYDLLSEGEKILFARLAVFQGGRSLEAIEAVCGEDLSIDVFDGLGSLVDKSMVRQIEDELGEPRFIMLETIHEYARECLEIADGRDNLYTRHAQYFADLTAYASPLLFGTQQMYWYQKLNIELDNIRAALGWSFSSGDVEIGMNIISQLNDFWFYEGYHVEGQDWTNRAMEHIEEVTPHLQLGVLQTAARMAYVRHQLDQSIPFQKWALEIARQLKDEESEAWILFRLAIHEHDASKRTQQDYEEALVKCEQSIATYRKYDNKPELSQALMVSGILHMAHGNYHQAQDVYFESLSITRETGDRRRETMMLSSLVRISVALEEYQSAAKVSKETLGMFQDLSFDYMFVLQLAETFSLVPLALGHPNRATRLLGASFALRESMNIRFQPNQLIYIQRIEDDIRQQLDEATFQTEWEIGRNMSLEEVVEFALEELSEKE